MTANEVLARTHEDHVTQAAPLDTNSTDGIRRTLAFHTAALQRLADFIDGKIEDAPLLTDQGNGQKERRVAMR